MHRRDWRQIKPNDPVKLARSPVSGDMVHVFTSLSDGQEYQATWDAKSATMAQHHLQVWAKVGHCTATLSEAARRSRGR